MKTNYAQMMMMRRVSIFDIGSFEAQHFSGFGGHSPSKQSDRQVRENECSDHNIIIIIMYSCCPDQGVTVAQSVGPRPTFTMCLASAMTADLCKDSTLVAFTGHRHAPSPSLSRVFIIHMPTCACWSQLADSSKIITICVLHHMRAHDNAENKNGRAENAFYRRRAQNNVSGLQIAHSLCLYASLSICLDNITLG